MRRVGRLGYVPLVVVVLAVYSSVTVLARSPTPAPPVQVRPGQMVTIAPGQTVVFLRPSIRVPGADNAIRVVNESEQPAAAVDDGTTITLTVPEGYTILARTEYETTSVESILCPTDPDSPNVALCRVEERRANHFVRFTTTRTAPATEQVRLIAGCNNVALTWPQGTPTALIARAVSPEGALVAIWRYDAQSGRFLAWSPLSGAPNDLPSVGRLDAVFICVRQPATLARPAL